MSEQSYLDLLHHVMENGTKVPDRTGVGTRTTFGAQIRFDLTEGFPLITTKKLYTRAIIHELLWILKGDTNIGYLRDNNVHIWDEWADEKGDLGPVYGKQWRHWEGAEGKVVDQISELIENLKNNPHSRRHVITAWNVAELENMALAPCHCLFQFHVANNKLSCQLYQRSADMFLGVPFNIASYALLTHMIAQVVGLEVGDFVHTFGDAHIYNNHEDQVREQLTRTPYPFPTLKLNPDVSDIFSFTAEDITIEGYKCHPTIKAPVAV